jgi:hypothetical protein
VRGVEPLLHSDLVRGHRATCTTHPTSNLSPPRHPLPPDESTKSKTCTLENGRATNVIVVVIVHAGYVEQRLGVVACPSNQVSRQAGKPDRQTETDRKEGHITPW